MRRGRIAAAFGLVLLAGTSSAQETASPFRAPFVVDELDAEFVAAPDYDGDGDADVFSAWMPQILTAPAATTLQLRGYRNLGQGQLAADWSLAVPFLAAVPKRVSGATADFDGDGLDDVALVVGEYLTVAYSNGAGAAPSTPWLSSVAPGSFVALAAADFDLDGDPDLAVTTQTTFRIYLCGGRALPTLVATVPGNTYAQRVVIADLDGVPPLDVVLAGGLPGSGGVARWTIAPGGAPGASVVTAVTGDRMQVHAASGDLDGDGDDDLLVTSDLGARYVLRRTGPATFVQEPTTFGARGVDRLADLDGDGDLDGVGVSPLLTPAASPTPSVNVQLADAAFEILAGGGFVVASWTTPFVGEGRTAGVVDLDGDGDFDVVAGRSVIYGRGVVPPPWAHGADLPFSSVPYFQDARARPLDLDADGDADLRINLATRDLNDGAGAFSTVPTQIPTVTTLYGDGDVDLVVEHVAPGGAPGSRLLRNEGDGRFADGGPATAPGVSFTETVPPSGSVSLDSSALTTDVDGDGDVDVVIRFALGALSSYRFARPWLNDGTGVFTATPSLPGFAEAFADFDGDGDADVLLRQVAAPASLTPWFRTSGGAYVAGAAPLTTVTDDSATPAVADLDGDGDVDVAAFEPAGLRIFWNDGSGGFPSSSTPAGTSSQGPSPAAGQRRAFAADLDLDGVADLVLRHGSGIDPSCAVLRGIGGGAFAAPARQAFSPLALADVDGDGDLDAVTRTHVVPNRTRFAPSNGFRRQYGAGTPGSGGVVPNLGAAGPVRVGGAVTVRLRGAFGGASGVLVLGLQPVAVPAYGATLLASPDAFIPFTCGGP
ncbi:MAG TPA: VCBS repeat-containing protein, partial [Planctomycetota bacterium]|nr:VCBS repeat-containing protein [Planctomycetota bacterium]